MDTEVVVRWEVEADQLELAALELWDRGATAVQVEPAALVAAFPTPAAAAEVAEAIGATLERVAPGWADAWRDHAEPVAVGERLVVAPAWRPVPVGGGRLVVEIDPGPCFGSGAHASTRLALALLSEAPVPDRVLDVGTGSGVLAVVAARLGARSVVAVDIDPAAEAVVAGNARRNGVADRVHPRTTPVAELAGRFDLALVNVTAGVHAELGPHVEARVPTGGRIVVAGLLPGQWQHVTAAYAGCRIVEERALDGWVGAVLSRR